MTDVECHYPDHATMNRTLYTLVTLVAVSTSLAQAPQFQWAHALPLDFTGSGGVYDSPPYQIAAHPDGGCTVLGVAAWSRNYGGQMYGTLQLVHFDAAGAQDMNLLMPGAALGSQLKVAEDGSMYMLGLYLDSVRFDADHLLSTTDNDLQTFFAKLDPDGSVAWAQDLSAQYGTVHNANGLVIDAQGDPHIALRVNGGSRIMHYDPDGNVLGTIVQANNISVFSVDVDALGNTYVTGSCIPSTGGLFGGVSFVPGGNGYNRYLARYNAAGQPTFVKFAQDVTCSDSEVRCDGPDRVYWAGNLINTTFFDSYQLNGPSNGSTPDFHIASVDSSGNYAWVIEGPTGQNIGMGVGERSYLDVDDEGNVLLAGYVRGAVDWPDGSTTVAGGVFDAVLLSYAPDGSFRWVKQGANTTVFENMHGTVHGADGHTYVCGLTRGTLGLDALTVSSGGVENFPFVARLGAEISTGLAERANDAVRFIHAPGSDRISMISNDALLAVRCYDGMGRAVPVQWSGTTVNISALVNGWYALHVETTGGSLQWAFVR